MLHFRPGLLICLTWYVWSVVMICIMCHCVPYMICDKCLCTLHDRYEVSSRSVRCVTVYLTWSVRSVFVTYMIGMKCRHDLYDVSLCTLHDLWEVSLYITWSVWSVVVTICMMCHCVPYMICDKCLCNLHDWYEVTLHILHDVYQVSLCRYNFSLYLRWLVLSVLIHLTWTV
jgi:hypothetical protein